MPITQLILFAVISFLFWLIALYVWIKIAFSKGIVAEDAHKEDHPKVANLGGIVLFLIPIIMIFAWYLYPQYERIYLALTLSVMIGALVGLIDDKKDLGLIKAGFVALAGIPIVLLGVYNNHPYLPIIGSTRMTILYPLVILIFFSIFADASNMIDIFNGVLVGQGLVVMISLLFLAVIMGSEIGVLLALLGLSYTLAFLVWNKYPAKVFHGNVGAYGYGALIAAIIILMANFVKGAEVVAIVAFLPAIFNGFVYVFYTGFAPRKRLGVERKAVILEGLYLKPNKRKDSAINLTKLLVSIEPKDERGLIRLYYGLFALALALAILTGYLIHIGFL